MSPRASLGVKRGGVVIWRHNNQFGFHVPCQARQASASIKLIGMSQRWKAQKSIQHRSRLIAGSDDANPPYGFFAPPERSRNIGFDQLRTGAQMLQNSFRRFQRVTEQQRAVFWNLEGLNICKELCL
jgi:hypothetical protein